MNIRLMTADDLSIYKNDIALFIYESVRMSNYEDGYCLCQAEQKCDELHGYLMSDRAIIVGAFEDNCMLGFLWAYEYPFREDKNRLYVSIVHVKEKYRNQHIGARLLEKIETVAKERNFDAIYLHAEASNVRACRFYEHMQYSCERVQLVKQLNDTYTGDAG